ncbi:hypothetical protein THAOC_02961, partial [Thalassiosira oceanica]
MIIQIFLSLTTSPPPLTLHPHPLRPPRSSLPSLSRASALGLSTHGYAFISARPRPFSESRRRPPTQDSEDVRVGQQQARRALRDPAPPPDGPAPRLLSSLASRDEAAALSALADPSLDVYAPLKPKGVCAVHVAASCGSLNVLREILGRGVRADYSDHNGMAALHHASSSSSMGPNEALETVRVFGGAVRRERGAEGRRGTDPLRRREQPGREGLPPAEAAAAGDGAHEAAQRGAAGRIRLAAAGHGRDGEAPPPGEHGGPPPALGGMGSPPPPAMGTPRGNPAMGDAQQQQIPPPGPAQQMPPGPDQVGLSLSASLEVQQQQQSAPPLQASAPPVQNDGAQPAMTAPAA